MNGYAKRNALGTLVPSEQSRRIPQDRWRAMNPQQRIEELTGHSLDKCRDFLDMPIMPASPGAMSAQVQVIRAILTAVTRVGMESTRLKAMQNDVLERLIENFDAAEQPNGVRPPNGQGRR